jgi:hypothetical protein
MEHVPIQVLQIFTVTYFPIYVIYSLIAIVEVGNNTTNHGAPELAPQDEGGNDNTGVPSSLFS